MERGEVGLDDRLDRHLPELAGSPAGTVTLAELASHPSGLPAMADNSWAQTIPEDLAGTELSIFQASLPELLDASRSLEPTGRGAFAYSNLGPSLLGHALARAGGTPGWETYVTTRLLTPLGMNDTRFISPGDRDPDLTRPRLAGGRAVEPWTRSGYAPAGADFGGPPPLWASLSERDFYPIPALVLMLVLVAGALRGRNRLGLIARGTWGVAGLLLLWLAGPWHLVPGGLMAGAVAGSLVVVWLRWGPLPLRPRRFLWLSVPVLTLGAVFGAAMVGITVRALQIG